MAAQPDHLREPHASAGRPPFAGERRMATIVFSDLSGYTAMNEAVDPEDVVEHMDLIRAEASRIAEQHGGLLNQIVGDEVVMLFGVPTAHDDDPLRAVLASLLLHQRVAALSARMEAELGYPLRMHSGVHTGLVLVTSGDERGGVYAITGDTVNTCARIRSQAEPDQVMVGPTTRRAVAPYFHSVATEPMTLKGKSEPLVAHLIVGRTRHTNRFDVARARGLQTHIGRERELSMLDEELQQALAGAPRSVALIGEAGVGKSRLLHELCRKAQDRGALLLVGRCDSYGDVAPYQPFVGVLRELFALDDIREAESARERRTSEAERVAEEIHRRCPALARQIPYYLKLLGLESTEYSLPRQTTGVALQEMLLDALCELFSALGKERGLALAIEDWHWADPASELAMQRVLAGLTGPAIVVLSMRTEHRPSWSPPHSRSVHIGALDKRLTTELAARVLAVRSLSESLERFLFDRTGGNPLFVEEFCAMLVEKHLIEIDNEAARLRVRGRQDTIPFTVQSVVRSRIDRLRKDEGEVLSLAAVMGTKVPTNFLRELTDNPEVLPGCLRELETVRLLCRSERGNYAFSHAVVQEVAYEAILKKVRRELHRRVAHLIEQTGDGGTLATQYESLAYHYGAAGALDEAARYAELAGDKAIEAHALEQAAAQYRRAVSHLSGMPPSDELTRRRIRLSLKWGRVAIWKPDPQQRVMLDGALVDCEQLGDVRGAGQALYWQGWHLYTLGEHAKATQLFQRCIEKANESGQARLAAQAHANLAYCHIAGRYADKALACLQRAREPLKGSTPGGRVWGDMLMDGYEGMLHGDRGDYERAYACLDAALRVARQWRNPPAEGSALTQLAMVQCQQGAFDKARQTARALKTMAGRIQSEYLHAMALTAEGQAQTYLDDDPEAGAVLTSEAVERLEELGIRITMSWNRACQAEAFVLAGDFDGAERCARHATERREAGDRRGQIMALRVLALVTALGPARDPTGAFERLKLALERARRDQLPREQALCEFWRAELFARLGNRNECREVASAILPALTKMAMPYYTERATLLATR